MERGRLDRLHYVAAGRGVEAADASSRGTTGPLVGRARQVGAPTVDDVDAPHLPKVVRALWQAHCHHRVGDEDDGVRLERGRDLHRGGMNVDSVGDQPKEARRSRLNRGGRRSGGGALGRAEDANDARLARVECWHCVE